MNPKKSKREATKETVAITPTVQMEVHGTPSSEMRELFMIYTYKESNTCNRVNARWIHNGASTLIMTNELLASFALRCMLREDFQEVLDAIEKTENKLEKAEGGRPKGGKPLKNQFTLCYVFNKNNVFQEDVSELKHYISKKLGNVKVYYTKLITKFLGNKTTKEVADYFFRKVCFDLLCEYYEMMKDIDMKLNCMVRYHTLKAKPSFKNVFNLLAALYFDSPNFSLFGRYLRNSIAHRQFKFVKQNSRTKIYFWNCLDQDGKSKMKNWMYEMDHYEFLRSSIEFLKFVSVFLHMHFQTLENEAKKVLPKLRNNEEDEKIR